MEWDVRGVKLRWCSKPLAGRPVSELTAFAGGTGDRVQAVAMVVIVRCKDHGRENFQLETLTADFVHEVVKFLIGKMFWVTQSQANTTNAG